MPNYQSTRAVSKQKVNVNFDHAMYNHKGEPMQSNTDYTYEDLALLMET